MCVLGGKPWDADWWAVLVDFGQKHGFNMGLKAGKHMLVTLGLSETWGYLVDMLELWGNWLTRGKVGEGRVQGGREWDHGLISWSGGTGSWVPQVASTGDTCLLEFGDWTTCGV